MRLHVRFVLVTVLLACSTGCTAPGLIFTDITRPLDLDMHVTQAADRSGEGDIKSITYWVSVWWDSAAIADAAHERGLTELYYADERILSVWFGLWQQRYAIVYGR